MLLLSICHTLLPPCPQVFSLCSGFLSYLDQRSRNGLNQLGIWGLAGVLCHFLSRAVNPCKVNFSFCTHVDCLLDFPGDSDSKASVYNVGDLGLIPGSGRFPGEGNGTPLQSSCLENPMEGGAWCRLLSTGSQRVGHDWATSLTDCLYVVPDSIFGSAAYSPPLFHCNTHSEAGEGNGNPHHYSCLENPMGRGA